MSLCLPGTLETRDKVIATIIRLKVNSSGASATILKGKEENVRNFVRPHKALQTNFSPTQQSAPETQCLLNREMAVLSCEAAGETGFKQSERKITFPMFVPKIAEFTGLKCK